MIITGCTVFIVVSVSMLNKLRLGVLGVAKLLMTVFMCMLCVLRGRGGPTSLYVTNIPIIPTLSRYDHVVLGG